MRWLRSETDVEPEVLLWRGGELVPHFEALAPTSVVHQHLRRRSIGENVELGIEELGLRPVARAVRRARVRRHRSRVHPDLVYLNGVGASVPLAALGPSPSSPVLAHVHELADGAARAVAPELGSAFWTLPRRWVAVAPRVARFVEDQGVAAGVVDVVPGFIPDHPRGERARDVAPASGAAPLVVALGAGSWRKGIDLFVSLAASLHHRRPDVRFAWVGRLDDPDRVGADVAAAGLVDVLALPGEVEDPAPWLAAADLVVSTAREDPFPLAGLEALAGGTRVITFDNGGLADLVATGDRADVVAPLDLVAMSDRIEAVLADPTPPPGLVERVRRDHTVDVVGPALYDAMQRTVG